jgi:hypothetical protein
VDDFTGVSGSVNHLGSQLVQVWPLLASNIIDGALNGEAQIGKLSLLCGILVLGDEFPCSFFGLIEVQETVNFPLVG